MNYNASMAERDSSAIILSRSTVLLVTGVGVGLLTLTYVLGVQVGKQSAALRPLRMTANGDAMTDLPASLDDQLKQLEQIEKDASRPPQKKAKPIAPVAAASNAPNAGTTSERWYIQLAATKDEEAAQRVLAQVKTAGFQGVIVKEGLTFKVRYVKAGPRKDMEEYLTKLKGKGLECFLVME